MDFFITKNRLKLIVAHNDTNDVVELKVIDESTVNKFELNKNEVTDLIHWLKRWVHEKCERDLGHTK